MSEESNHSKPSRFTLFMWRLSSLFFSTIIHVILFIFTLIKWLFSPIAMLFMIFVGIPFGRFAIKIPIKPNFRRIDEADVPDGAWLNIEQSKQNFIRAGFIQGKYIKVDNISKHQDQYILPMLNRDQNIAVGINCISLNPGNKHESQLISCEFTTRCPNGEIIDLTSISENDPFPISSRNRIFFDTDDMSLHQLFLKIIDQKNCPCPEDILNDLDNIPEKITLEEYNSSLSNGLKNNYVTIKGDNYHLTWKGAFSSAYRTLWPTSEFFERKKEQQAINFFQDIGVDLNSYDWFDAQEEGFSEQLSIKIKGINSAIEAAKNLADKFDPQAKVTGLIINNALDKKGIESISILYENYQRLREGRIHCFNSFYIEHLMGSNKIELIDEDNYLLSDEEWLEYEIAPKNPLPELLAGICSTKEASEIALKAIRNKMKNNDYIIESIELNADNPDNNLVWILDAYPSDDVENEDDNETGDIVSIQCIINAHNKQIISIEED